MFAAGFKFYNHSTDFAKAVILCLFCMCYFDEWREQE